MDKEHNGYKLSWLKQCNPQQNWGKKYTLSKKHIQKWGVILKAISFLTLSLFFLQKKCSDRTFDLRPLLSCPHSPILSFLSSGPPPHKPCLLSGGLPVGGYQMTQLEHHTPIFQWAREGGVYFPLFLFWGGISTCQINASRLNKGRQEFACKEKTEERRRKVPFRQHFSFGQTCQLQVPWAEPQGWI